MKAEMASRSCGAKRPPKLQVTRQFEEGAHASIYIVAGGLHLKILLGSHAGGCELSCGHELHMGLGTVFGPR